MPLSQLTPARNRCQDREAQEMYWGADEKGEKKDEWLLWDSGCSIPLRRPGICTGGMHRFPSESPTWHTSKSAVPLQAVCVWKVTWQSMSAAIVLDKLWRFIPSSGCQHREDRIKQSRNPHAHSCYLTLQAGLITMNSFKGSLPTVLHSHSLVQTHKSLPAQTV